MADIRLSEVEQLKIENSVLHSLVLSLNQELKASHKEIRKLQYVDAVIRAVGGDTVGSYSMDVKTGR